MITSDNYNIYFEDSDFTELNAFLLSPQYESAKIFILVDENTFKYCLPPLLENIEILQESEIIEVESGEENKVIEICVEVWQALTELNADRKSLIINLGGGVITDMGGFIASTFKRGIDFINVPTTLLAQADACIGGKVGVDLEGIKNQVGLFSNPKAVFINPEFLSTLDERQVISGFAEIIKHNLISRKNYWDQLHLTDVIDIVNVEEYILHSIEIKNNIVLLDPFEQGIRKSLNFGHTIGHSMESYSFINDEVPLLHGEAIAIGLVCEAYLSYKITGLPNSQLEEITTFVKNLYTPYPLNTLVSDALINLMQNDKKNERHKINFTLLKQIGEVAINQSANEDLIKEALSYYSQEFGNAITLN